MPGSRTARALDLAALVAAAALPVAVIATLRALPPADLAAVRLGWLAPAVALAAAVSVTLAATAGLVAVLRGGTIAAVCGMTAAAAVAGGALALAIAGSAGGLLLALPAAGILVLAVAVADRTAVATAWSSRGWRVAASAGGLVVAEALVVAGLLVATMPATGPLVPVLLASAVATAGIAAVVAADRWLAAAAAATAVGSAGLLADRGGGLEAVVGLLALLLAGLAGLRAATHRERRTAGVETAELPPLAHHLPDAVLQFDGDLRLRDWNAPATTLLGLDAHARGTRLEDLLGVPIAGLPAAGDVGVSTTAVGGLEVRLHRYGGGVVAVIGESRVPADEDRLGRELRGTIEELLQARRTIELQRAEIERASTVDLLTGVASRSAILDRLRIEIAQARRYHHPVAVVLLDVDRFGEINGRHGIRGGDALLREVALRMRLRVREADALGRAGSDGFLAVLPHTDEAGAAIFAAALRQRLAQRPIAVGDELVPITVSVGVAVMRPGEDVDLDGLLARLGEAIDSARMAGGNRIALDRDHGFLRLAPTGDDHEADQDQKAT